MSDRYYGHHVAVNSHKRTSRAQKSARTGRRTKPTGFSTRSFFAGIAVGILATLGVSLIPSSDLGNATSSSNGGDASNADPLSTRYEFWEKLPTSEVSVNTNPYATGTLNNAGAKEYLLQVGSFRKQDEADVLRAELLLGGMAATTSEVRLAGEDIWYRVLVGPYKSPRETREAMSELRTKKISALVLERSPRGG